jgi:L-malate glycosyltransferase
MRVAIIVSAIRYLGPVKVMETLVNSLPGRDIRIEVFHLDKIPDGNVHMEVPVKRLIVKSFPFEDYDIIHTNGIRPDLFAFLFRKRIKYHISTIHNFVFDDLKFTYNRFISFIFGFIWLILLRKADTLVCVSETMKNYYTRWFSHDKLKVIYNGVTDEPEMLIPDKKTVHSIEEFRSQGLRIIGTASFLTKRKGIDQVLRLLASNTTLALVVIGEGKEFTKLKELTSQLGVTSRCLFCGFLFHADQYFHLFDVFIMPSRSEGFGLSMIEAISRKVPVICSDIPVFRELLNQDEVTFFKLEDITSLKNALRSADGYDRKVNAAYIRYLKCYTGRIMANSYYELYKTSAQ